MAQKNLRETLRGIKAGAVTVTRDEPRVVPIREANSGTVSENRDELKDYLSKVRKTQDALAVQQNYKARQPKTSYVEDAKSVMPRVESGLTLPAIDTFAASDITFRNRQRDASARAYAAGEDMLASDNHRDYQEAEERRNAALQDMKEAKSRVKANEGAKWMSDKAYQYSGLWKNDDYGEKSRADAEILKKGETAPDFSGFLGSKGTNTNLYYNVNQGRNALLFDTEVIGGKAHAGLPAYAYMTDSEVRNFNYIYATEGAKAAREYYDWLEHDLNYRKANDSSEYWAKAAQEHPGAASVASVGLTLASGAGIVNLAAQNVKKAVTGSNEPIDYNAPALSLPKASTEIRSTVADELSKRENGAVKSFLYQTGMSMADSGVVAVLGAVGVPAAAALLGGSAAASAALEARERGASDGKALMSGIAAGIVESLFEELSLEKLIHPKSVSGLKDVISNVLRQSFTEGSEEFFTTLANTVTDAFINGDRSEINSRIAELMQERDENGSPVYEAKEAEEIAWKEWLTNLGADFLGGAVSGGVMGGGASTINYAATRLDPVIRNERTLGKNLKAAGITNDQIKGMVAQSWIRTLGNETVSDYFDALSQRIADGEDLTQMSDAELGALYELYTDVTGGQISKEAYRDKVRRITEARTADEESLTLPTVDETQPETTVQAPHAIPAATVSEDAPISPLASGALYEAVNRVRNGETLSGNDARRIMADESAMQELRNTGLLDAVRPGTEGRRQVLDAVQRLSQNESAIMKDPETAENPVEAPENLTPQTTDAETPENLTLPEMPEAQTAGSTREEAVRQLSRRIKAGESISEEEIARTLNGELTQTGGNGTMEAPIITEGVDYNGRTETSGNPAGENGGNVGDWAGAYRRSERKNRVGSGEQGYEAALESLRSTRKQRERQRSIRYLVEALGLDKVSTASQDVSGGTENATLTIIPDSLDERTEKVLEEIGFRKAQRKAAADGITLKGFVGTLEFEEDGVIHTARGYTSSDGKTMLVQLDHPNVSWDKLFLHEHFHVLKKRNPGLLKSVAQKFDEDFTEDERRAIVDDYIDAYGFYDVSEDYVLEEVLADYYAGIDVFAGGEDAQSDLGKRQASVMRAVREAAQNGQERTEADTGGRFSFIGPKAQGIKFADRVQLGERAEQNGETPEDIFKYYGVFRGADGKWRAEISDDISQYDSAGALMQNPDARRYNELTQKLLYGSIDDFEQKELRALDSFLQGVRKAPMYLDELLWHPDLYDAYPMLRSTIVRFDELDGENGYYNRKNREIVLDKSLRNNAEAARATLLHEIQHAIQLIEGFSRGANSAMYKGRETGGRTAKQMYADTAGEIEARETAARADMPDSFRRRKFPTVNAERGTVFAEDFSGSVSNYSSAITSKDRTYDFSVTQNDVNRYVDNAYGSGNEEDYKKYLRVNSRLKSDVGGDIPDISDYTHALRDNDIRHIRNSHGERTNEKYPVTADDLKTIPDIVENYDKAFVVYNNGKKGIIYVKIADENLVYYLEAATDVYHKEKLLVNKQMIKTGIEDIPDLKGLKAAIEKKQTTQDFLADLKKARKVYAQDVSREVSASTDKDSTDGKNVKGKFSMEMPAEETDRLVALHNISESGLLSALELGGLAMPSFAVMRAGTIQNGYGDITIVAGKDSIDPKIKNQSIFGGDAWTPTFPEISYKISKTEQGRIVKRIESLLGSDVKILGGTSAITDDNLSHAIQNADGDFAKAVKNNRVMQVAFLRDSGESLEIPRLAPYSKYGLNAEDYQAILDAFGGELPRGYDAEMSQEEKLRNLLRERTLNAGTDRETAREIADALYSEELSFSGVDDIFNNTRKFQLGEGRPDTKRIDTEIKAAMEGREAEYADWLNELGRGIVEKKGIYNDKDIFTASGNRRSWDALHYDFTLANIVKAMQKQPKQGKTGFLTATGSVKGAALKSYNSVEDVRADIGRLSSEEDETAKEAYRKFGESVREIADRISDDPFDGSEALADILSHTKTKTAIYRYLTKEYDYLEERGIDLESLAEDIAELGKEANTLPMEYFEAKVYRAFPADEALAYVVPDDVSRRLIDGLEAQGLNVLTYEAGNEADRLAKINSVEGARFSRNLPGETAELQDEYDKLKEKLAYWKGQVKRTEHYTLREADTKRLTKSILDQYSSKADAGNIGERVKSLGEYLMNGDEGGVRWVDAHDDAVRIARDIIQNASALVDDGERDTYRRMKAYFHGKSIRVTNAKNSITDYNDFRKRNFGKFILSDNGAPIDTLWGELQEEFGKGYFPDEVMNQEDMIFHVSDLLDALRDNYENPYQGYYAEAVEYCANDILDRLLSDEVRQTPPTFADKAETRLARQALQWEDKLERQAERFEERYQKRVLKDEERYQRVRYLLDQERENRKAQVEEVKRSHRSKEAKAREARKAAALRKKITSHARELTSLLLKPSDKRHIPKGLEKPVAALLNAIDLSSGYVLEFGRDGKYHRVDPTLTIGGEETQRTEAFRQIQEQLRKMKGEWADDGTLFGDTEEPGLFTTVIEDYADIPIANMNSEQLQTVWDALRTVEGAIRSMNRLFSTTRWQNQAELAADIRKQNAGKTKPKEYRGFFGKAQNTAGIDAMTPEAYFHRLGAVGDEMFRLARDAQDRNIRIIDEARQKTEEIVGDTDVRKLEREMHTVTFGGEPVQISTAQLMELYALSRRDQGLQHILTGGILIEETQKGLVRNISVEPVRVTPADLSEAISMLTAEQRRMAERMQEYLSVDMARVGNEAAVQVYNYEKFGRDGIYWPIRTNKNEVATEVGNDNKVTTPAQRGFTKAVKPNAKTSLKVGSIFDTYAKHISDMANYASWLGFTEDMNRVRNFNFKDADGISTGTVKGILNRVYGSGGAAYLENLLADISNGAGVDEKAMTNEFVGNYKAAAIGANLRVILQQPTAILRAADMIDGKYLAAGLANPFKGFEESKKYAPISIWKDWGYFDINTGRQMKDVLFDNTDKLAKAKELSMALAGKADSFAWGQLWNACKAEARAETNLEPGSREFFRHVADRFNEIIDHTQVVDGVLQRSQAMRSKSWLMKTATSFMAEPTKQYNMFLSAVYDAKHGDDKAKKRLARTVAALLISGIVNSVVQSVWDAVRDDDKDKEYWEKFLSAFIGYDPEADTFRKGFKSYFDSNVGTMLNPGSYIPFFKDAVSLLQGYEVSRMDMAAIDGMISAASSWVKSVKGESKKTAGYATMKLIENAAKLLGIPLYNIERDLTAITDTIATATKSYPLQYQMYRAVNRPPDSGKPNADVTTMLYNAYMADNGDYDQITRMMEKDGYDAEEIRKAVETKWKSEHGITDALKAVDPEGDYNLLDIVTAVDSLELPTADADLVLSMELEDKQLEKYTAARKSGVSPETYIEAVLTLPKFDLNSNGSYSGDEVEAALKSMKGLNDEKRAVLWQTLSDAKTAANNPFDADAGMEFLITSASVDIPELVLPTADGDTTDFSKELSKAKKLSDKERLAAIGEIIGTEMKNESGKPSQYAKLIDCLDKGCSFDEWSRLIQYDYGVDQYLKLRESGVSHSGSMSLTETIKNLSPAAGKSSVSDEQKINSVVGTKLSDKEKLSAIGTIIGTDMTTDSGNPTQWAKLNTAVNDGLSVDDAIRMAQNDTLDDYIRWRDSAVRQSGVKSDVYISYRSETAKISADKDANGKSISGSKKEKVLKYINSLKLTAAQKDALYYDAGYAESGIDDAPWHGLQLPTE